MTRQEKAERILLELVADCNFTFEKWFDSKFRDLKFASATEKGTLGEDLLAELFRQLGYDDVETIGNRRGHYDVGLKHNGKHIKFEVKVATQDTSGNFQFNGIRTDTKYSHLFCCGIMPNLMKYRFIPKSWLNNRDGYMMVSMAKNTNSAFKLTRSSRELFIFDNFQSDVEKILRGEL